MLRTKTRCCARLLGLQCLRGYELTDGARVTASRLGARLPACGASPEEPVRAPLYGSGLNATVEAHRWCVWLPQKAGHTVSKQQKTLAGTLVCLPSRLSVCLPDQKFSRDTFSCRKKCLDPPYHMGHISLRICWNR